IHRECLLPENAIGNIRVSIGKRVDIRDVVIQSVVPSRYIILDVMHFFGLKKMDALADFLHVGVGDLVQPDQVIAGKSLTKGKRLRSPVKGLVAHIENGRIILQEMPDVMNLEAGVRGRVVQVDPQRGVVIEAVGAQTQGVWGNGRLTIGTLTLEPEEGIENIQADTLERRFTGSIVVTRRPLTAAGFKVMIDQSFAGVIAPSMDASLIELAMMFEGSVLLTEGFGNIRMSSVVYNMLAELAGNQTTLDAYTPSRWETRTPEAIISVPRGEQKNPSRPNAMTALRTGMTVRITREPYLGLTGKILDLPTKPVLLDNGLRILAAQIELVVGETVFVPLANLEILGR
ncbi:MAG: hypothetical protein CUN56_05830, partial [Phototrophicales bacterium]